MEPIILDTLGKLADDGYELNCWCPKCERGGLIPFETIAQKFGRDYGITLKGKISCSKCGGRNIELRYSPSSLPAHRKENAG